jgi:hypothetical protein
MGVFIHKAKVLLEGVSIDQKVPNQQRSYFDVQFSKVVKNNYIAIISKPGGYWTNDLTIPLIYYKGQCVTPIYGGDQYAEGLSSVKALPLPFFETLGKSIRWRSISILTKNILFLIGPLGIMIRRYEYLENEVKIVTIVLSLFKFKQIFYKLEKKNPDFEITSRSKINILEGNWISPDGILKGFFTLGVKQTLKLKLKE